MKIMQEVQYNKGKKGEDFICCTVGGGKYRPDKDISIAKIIKWRDGDLTLMYK